MEIPVFGVEGRVIDQESGLHYTDYTIYDEPPKHTHNFFEFFIIVEGTALHMVNEAVQTVEKGDFFFIRPADVHHYGFYHSENFRKLNLGFTRQIYYNIALFFNNTKKLDALTEAEYPPHVRLEGERFLQAAALMREAGELAKKGSHVHARYHAQCILAMFFEDFFFTYEETETLQRVPQWLTGLLEQMQKLENLQGGYERMCSLAPCSPSHLGRILKQFYQKTPTEYINELRLNHAVYLLIHTDQEILEISESCGFSNLSHFYHLFKKRFGKSPASFRRQ